MLKQFKTFCFKTIKDSAFLMAKYLFVGVFLIVLTVFTNKMDLKSLTYFNAIFAILLFSDIFGFGISTATSIYINQNINNKSKILKYIKSGFNASFIISIIFTAILFLFKDFIFSNIVIVNISDKYLFLYLMLPVIFLNIVISYFDNVLKSLKEYKFQFRSNLLKDGLIFVGIVIISIFFKLNVYQIAFLYIVSSIFQLVYLWYMFKYKTKKINFDLLKITKIKSEKNKQFLRKIFAFSFIEITWQIGYSLSALFLLKKGEVIYNSYSYFENVLDIANGFYFALLNVASISICNSLGKNNKDEAFKNSCFTLLFIVIIWLFYFIVYLIFEPLFISGMNKDIVAVASSIAFMYLFIHLFRFIDWALSSYITNQGGKAKLIVIVEILSLIYFISIFIFAKYIPNNNLLLIFLVGLDSLVKTIIYLIYFFSKKWMVNIKN